MSASRVREYGHRLAIAAMTIGCPAVMLAQAATAPAHDVDGIWTIATPAPPPRTDSIRVRINGPHVVVALDRAALVARLARAPREDATGRPAGDEVEMALPMPDGVFARFRVVESPVLAPALAARFPEFKTYLGKGVDDPTAMVRFDWTAAGFHAMVWREAGPVLIDPEVPGDLTQYVSYRKADYSRPDDRARFAPAVITKVFPVLPQ